LQRRGSRQDIFGGDQSPVLVEINNAGSNIVERELAVMSENRHGYSTSGDVRYLQNHLSEAVPSSDGSGALLLKLNNLIVLLAQLGIKIRLSHSLPESAERR
jgi:hypothetical protein